jgi:hypothetical protein
LLIVDCVRQPISARRDMVISYLSQNTS